MTKFISIIFFFGLTACVHKAEEQKVDLKAGEQAVRSLSMKWLELNKGHDAASMAALFTDDGVVFRPNQEPTTGITAIKDLFTRDSEQNPKVVSIWATDRVEISTSGELAIEYGTWTDTGRGLDGTEEDHGKFVTVYRKINDVWKVSADISVSTKPLGASK